MFAAQPPTVTDTNPSASFPSVSTPRPPHVSTVTPVDQITSNPPLAGGGTSEERSEGVPGLFALCQCLIAHAVHYLTSGSPRPDTPVSRCGSLGSMAEEVEDNLDLLFTYLGPELTATRADFYDTPPSSLNREISVM